MRKHISGILFIFSIIVQTSFSQGTPSLRSANHFQQEVDAMIQRDTANPPPHHSIEFIGSSIFRLWKELKTDMAPLPVFNRAFGGSRTNDVLYFMDTLVFPYKPKLIVYYCGSNDAGASIPLDSIVDNIKSFFKRVEERLPETTIFFVSVNRSPARRAKWGLMDSTNSIMRKFCSESSRRKFIDVNPVLFDSSGEPRMEMYVNDQLHLTTSAYKEFTKIIKPIISEVWMKKH